MDSAVGGAVRYIHGLAREVGIDPSSVPLPRTTRQPPPRQVVRSLNAIIAECSSRSAGADAEERKSTARHEAAHAVMGHSLGWHVDSVDIDAGHTMMTPPDILSQSLSERHLQRAVIAASARAFMGARWDDEFESDRAGVRLEGFIRFEEAERKARLAAANPWVKAAYERLTAALLTHGRLEGAELRRILEDD